MIAGCLAGVLALGSGAGASGPASPHPNSFSWSEIHVRGADIRLELRVQVLSLGEVIQGFDRELDGHAEDGEIAEYANEIVQYVSEHYRLVVGEEGAGISSAMLADAKRLEVTSSLVVEAPLALDPMNEVSEWVDVVLTFDAPRAGFEEFGAYVDLFEVTSPGHRDSCGVVWNGLEVGAWQFAVGMNARVFEATEEMLARNAPVFGRYVRHGVERSATAWGLLSMALLLVVGARRSVRSAAATLTLFAVAGLAGAVLAHYVPWKPAYIRFVELAVPLGLLYLALDDLLHREGRTRLLEALVFGVIAGAREAVRMAPEVGLELDEEKRTAIAGLGCGVFGVLLLLFGVLSIVPMSGEGAQAKGARALRVIASIAALAWAGWAVFGERT